MWRLPSVVSLPKTATAEQMTRFARQLSTREQDQVMRAFSAGNFEMAATFLWSRAMAGLKKQLATLGLQFLGELLERPDIKQHDPIANVITDHEALRLAEELRMFGGTEAMRLRHALELVMHFADAPEEGEQREMTYEEAAGVLRSCVQSVLGHERFEGAVEFARFRHDLEARTFKHDDELIVQLLASPYFFRRTTLRVLLALVKSEVGAPLQHVLANLDLLIRHIWPELQKPDRWMVGRTYAEVHNSGNKIAAAGIGRALRSVNGFDFVPENLRSNTFIQAAKRLLATHTATYNFYNEPEPMRTLLSLGTTIPQPALADCLTATISVRIGNYYNRSWGAQDDAAKLLDRLTVSEWKYYLDECLAMDDIILGKLTQNRTLTYWVDDVVKRYNLASVELRDLGVKALLDASARGAVSKIRQTAREIHNRMHGTTEEP